MTNRDEREPLNGDTPPRTWELAVSSVYGVIFRASAPMDPQPDEALRLLDAVMRTDWRGLGLTAKETLLAMTAELANPAAPAALPPAVATHEAFARLTSRATADIAVGAAQTIGSVLGAAIRDHGDLADLRRATLEARQAGGSAVPPGIGRARAGIALTVMAVVDAQLGEVRAAGVVPALFQDPSKQGLPEARPPGGRAGRTQLRASGGRQQQR